MKMSTKRKIKEKFLYNKLTTIYLRNKRNFILNLFPGCKDNVPITLFVAITYFFLSQGRYFFSLLEETRYML